MIRQLMLIKILVLLSFQALSQDIVLTANAKTDYTIIIPQKATAIEEKAAKEFQQYIRKISGAVMPILNDNSQKSSEEVLIGNTSRIKNDLSSLTPDGIMIKTQGKN